MNRNTVVSAAVLVAALSGCRTNKDILMDYERSTVAGDYAKPVAEIEEKAADGGVDELMWRLHAGGSRYLLNALDGQSIAQFDKAEDIFIRNDQTSVFRQGTDVAFAMLTNDRAFPYAGAGEDRIFTCFYKAVDFAASGNRDAVRTELNRAAQHQDNWLNERKQEIADAEEKLREDADAYAKKEGGKNSTGADHAKSDQAVNDAFANSEFMEKINERCGFDAANGGSLEVLSRKDWVNRYVEYSTGVFRWIAGDGDGANYLRELKEFDATNALFRADYEAMSKGGRPQNSVWVLVEDGLCPVREEWRLDLPLILIPYLNRFVMYAGMAVPYLRYRDAACPCYSLKSGGADFPLVEIQDVDQLLKTEFDVYFRGALTREITRVVVKAGVQVALGVVAENCSDHYTKVALKASQVAAAAWAASVTQADLRCWSGLPKKVYAMRVNRPADGKLVLTGGGNNIAEITVPEGNTMVFVRKPSTAAPAVVKTFTLPN